MVQLKFWFASTCHYCKRPYARDKLIFEDGIVRHKRCTE
jgi:hypothetical protein